MKPWDVLVMQQRAMRPWQVVQHGAKGLKFKYDGPYMGMLRWFLWKYCWGGREYGLLWHDQAFEPDPVIAEALRRLNLKEPWLFDQRKIRLINAHNLCMHHEKLPKEQWTKWEDETWYLKPYVDEINTEIKLREHSSGLLPRFRMKKTEE